MTTNPELRERLAQWLAERRDCHARHAGVPCTMNIQCFCAGEADAIIAAFPELSQASAQQEPVGVPSLEDIAFIVCKHVPPTRMCDRGKTCECWAAYALPAAEEILEHIKRPASQAKVGGE